MTEREHEPSVGDLRAEVARLQREARERDLLVQRLEEAIAARDRFIAIAGHELRNPMGTLLMSISHLLHQVRGAPRDVPSWLPERVTKLEKHARLFVRRASTLLDVSRINAGQVHLDRVPLDLSDVVCDVLDGLETDAGRSATPLRRSIAPSITGCWDRTAVEQITFNLVSNAIKYGAGSPIDVELHAGARAATLRIRDRGVGISEEDRARVFEPFERAVTERLQGGFGLGLWITRQLVTACDGRVDVSSGPGEGSVFTVVLPRAIEEVEP